jgi:RNA polymerase sigma-70 factor (ECF subfamily)
MTANVDGTKSTAQDLRGVDLTPARVTGGTARLEPVRSESLEDAAISFAGFYAMHHDSVARALSVTLGDDHLATEAVDEAMARAYQRWDYVRDLESPGGWVYTVGLNWTRSLLRRSFRSKSIAGRESVSDIAAAQCSDPDLDRALRNLSIDQRAVVVCRHLIGYSELETARVLGIRPGTVKSRLNRALTGLRSSLADTDEIGRRDGR